MKLAWATPVIGAWVAVSPFVLTGPDALRWSNLVFGVAVAIFGYLQIRPMRKQ